VYNVDTFNEVTPPSTDPEKLKLLGESIFKVLTSEDEDAIWMLQGWMFYSDIIFWTKERAKAFLTSVPQGRMLVLDLQSEYTPQYSRLDSYFGQPFIWCLLHNFGGTLGLHGSVLNINQFVFDARDEAGSSMVGTGLTPEGTLTNYPIYDLMTEMAWRRSPVNLIQWFINYSDRRYGHVSSDARSAWTLLLDSVFSYRMGWGNHGKYIFLRHPRLDLQPLVWYPPNDVWRAWGLFVSASQEKPLVKSTLFRHDAVDVARQGLQLILDEYYLLALRAYRKGDHTDLSVWSSKFLWALRDLETLLRSDKHFLLGNWIESAKQMGTNDNETALYEMNARNQITLWGPNGEIRDYACKQWSGLIEDYYLPRWEIFFKALIDSLLNVKKYRPSAVRKEIFRKVERPFTYSKKVYPTEPAGYPLAISKNLFNKYIDQTTYLLIGENLNKKE